MGRVYTIQFNGVSASAAQDVFEYKASSAKPFTVHEIILGQISDYKDAEDEGLLILIKRATGAYTSGSGGSSPTPAPHNTSDTAAGGTSKANSTTQAVVGSGALTTLRPDVFNVRAGFQYLPTPETRFFFTVSEGVIVAMSAPADALTLHGAMVIEEFG